jgi:glycosyltransferase involved in cell wall biosynthesis
MRIAFDARAWERPPHSFSRVLRLLVLSARTMGWEFELWTEGELQPEFLSFQPRVLRVTEARERTRADLLWAPHPEFLPSHLPAVATVHDINPLLPDNRRRAARWIRAVRFRSHTRKTFESAWRVVTDSQDARDRIAHEFPAYARKLKIVTLFVDPGLQRPGDRERDAGLGSLGLSAGYILFLGSLRRHKNWDGLMRAYAGLPASMRRDHPLVLAGQAHRARRKALHLADRLGIRDRLVLPGILPEETIPALYAGALLFVFPSFLEGFGLPPLEAMACGVPVIATNRTSIPEILGDAPLYIDPCRPEEITEAMHRLIADASLREKLTRAGLRRAGEFGPERTGEMMRKVLEDISPSVENVHKVRAVPEGPEGTPAKG